MKYIIISQSMIKAILFIVLLATIDCQSQTSLTQPSLIETNAYTLRKEKTGITSLSTNINYMQNYTSTPLVFVSIVSMQSFTVGSVVNFIQSVTTITKTYFTIQYSFSCIAALINCTFSQIDIDYLAFDFSSYPFVQILQSTFTIDPSISLQNQFYQVQYLQDLNEDYSYSLNCMLTGFQGMVIIGQPYLYINVLQNNLYSYFFNINFNNLTVLTVHYLRILIDETTMNTKSTGISSLTCNIGTIYHYSDPNIVEDNPSPDFLPFAMFYGVSGFGGYDVSLTSLTYIFNNTLPRIQANIGYILFITKSCPTNQLYVSSQNLCYGLSSAFYYQATPATMQPCPYSCYQCVGPLTTQCKSCVVGWNRVLSSGRCLCISGFYDPGGPTCKNCTQAISGCKTCSSATNCITCLAGCTAIGFSPIYCDCPNFVQQNYSYNCIKTFYFDYTTNACTCLPQTYFNSNSNLCFPCATGCYICAKNSTYCLSCIDSYTLIKNTCTFYPISYSLLGQSSNYNTPQIRCLRWDSSNSICLQKCKYYYYQFNCYSKCPMGTFNISFPWLTCQPCQLSCQYCFNYTICYQCNSDYYYFNTSILSCSPCSSNCVKCLNGSYCTLCQDLYFLVDNFCQLPAIPPSVCPDNCSFCLISDQCLKCKIPYYLNLTSQICVQCSANLGLQLWADGCHQICGDGKLINDECDDGNTVSGDGCSSSCFIEQGYVCRQIGGKSYCWARTIPVDWQIISVFGKNQVIISLYSPTYPLSNSLLSIQCGFNFTLIRRATISNREELTLSFYESILLMQLSAGSNNTITYFSGNLSKNVCQILINQHQNLTIPVNKKPTPFHITYQSTAQSVNNGNFLKIMNKVAIYFTLGTSVLAISPMTSYSCLRLYILFLVSYLDYMHVPINAFGPYQSLTSLLFVPSSTTTAQLQLFTSEYYVTILWHLVVAYVAMVAFIEIIIPFVMRICKSMEWNLLSRIFSLITENKAVAYQNMYISYEIIIFILIAQTFYNIKIASVALIALVTIHLAFVIASKIHFCFTFQQLTKLYPQFTHTLVVQQFQNISIAALIVSTTSKSSFTCILMIVFAVYPLLSLDRNSPNTMKEGNYYITNQTAIWQLRIGYIFQIIIQFLKLMNMWSANIPLSQPVFESIGTTLGLIIGILTALFMMVSFLASFLSHLIRVCQIKNQGRATIPSMEDVQADVSSNPQ